MQIISISYTSCKVVADEASALVLLEDGEEAVHVETEEDGRDNCTLSDSISNFKLIRDLLLPPDICCLFYIDKNQGQMQQTWPLVDQNMIKMC